MPGSATLNTFGGLTTTASLVNLDTNFTNVNNLLLSWNNYSVYLADTGAANAYVVTLPAGLTGTLTAGLPIQFKAVNANTGASTLNFNATGIKNILHLDGTALKLGDIPANSIVQVQYDGTQYLLQSSAVSLGANTFAGTQTLSGAVLNEAKGANVASASSPDIWAVTGDTIHITGTVTHTGFAAAPQAGIWRHLVYDGACLLTNGANFVVQGNANYTTAANDEVDVYADTTTKFYLYPRKADGTALVASVTNPTANTQTISADLVLTSASAQLQIITASSAGLSVQFPDATTMTSLAFDKFVIQNAGTQVLGLRDGSATPGTLLRTVLPTGVARVSLSSTATAAGVWEIGGANLGHMLPRNERTLVSATPTAGYTGGNTSVIQLSSTIVVYAAQVTTTLYLTAHNLATGSIGTTVAITGWVNGGSVAGFSISATAGIWWTKTGATYRGVAFTVSGATITAGAATDKVFSGSITLTASRFQSQVAQLTTTTFLLVGEQGGVSPFQPAGVVASVSGTTITYGSITSIGGTIATTTPTFQEVIARSSTQAILIFDDDAATLAHARHISVSGTTITSDTAVSATQSGSGSIYSNIVLMQADEWWFVTGLTTDARVYRLTVSGVTLTMPAATALTAPAAFRDLPNTGSPERGKMFIKVDGSTAVFFHNSSPTTTAAYKITFSVTFTTSVITAAAMLLPTATNTDGQIVVAGTVTHGIILNQAIAASGLPASVSVVSLTSGNPTQAGCISMSSGACMYAVFYNGRLYLISANLSAFESVCLDPTTGQELSRQAIRHVNSSTSNTAFGNIELAGSRVVFSKVNTTAPFAGQYTTVVELV